MRKNENKPTPEKKDPVAAESQPKKGAKEKLQMPPATESPSNDGEEASQPLMEEAPDAAQEETASPLMEGAPNAAKENLASPPDDKAGRPKTEPPAEGIFIPKKYIVFLILLVFLVILFIILSHVNSNRFLITAEKGHLVVKKGTYFLFGKRQFKELEEYRPIAIPKECKIETRFKTPGRCQIKEVAFSHKKNLAGHYFQILAQLFNYTLNEKKDLLLAQEYVSRMKSLKGIQPDQKDQKAQMEASLLLYMGLHDIRSAIGSFKKGLKNFQQLSIKESYKDKARLKGWINFLDSAIETTETNLRKFQLGQPVPGPEKKGPETGDSPKVKDKTQTPGEKRDIKAPPEKKDPKAVPGPKKTAPPEKTLPKVEKKGQGQEDTKEKGVLL